MIIKLKRLVLSVVAGLAMVAVYAAPASADLLSTLNIDGCSGGCGSTGIPPFGTITLYQVDANTVQITETLVPGVEFVNTGAGDAIVFNTTKAVTLSNISSGFSQDPAGLPIHVGFFGNFDYGILCSGCGSGGSSPLPGPLTFTAADGGTLSITDFIGNSGGFFFAADIINENAPGTTKPTGVVGTSGPDTLTLTTTSVPEPRLRCGATYRKDWAAFRLTVLEAGYVTIKGKPRAGECNERPLKSEDRYRSRSGDRVRGGIQPARVKATTSDRLG